MGIGFSMQNAVGNLKNFYMCNTTKHVINLCKLLALPCYVYI